MKLNKEIFIFYNLFAFGTLFIGFFSSSFLIQNKIINFRINPIIILFLLIILFTSNYYFFGRKVQKLFEKTFE